MRYTYSHPKPGVTTDVVLFRKTKTGLEILLIQRGTPPFTGSWALPGGFVEKGECLIDAARRELAEETGLTGVNLRQLAAFGKPGRDPRGWTISVAFWGWLTEAGKAEVPVADDDAADARWWSITALPSLAFDHAEIIEVALERLAEDRVSTNHRPPRVAGGPRREG